MAQCQDKQGLMRESVAEQLVKSVAFKEEVTQLELEKKILVLEEEIKSYQGAV
ncbi:hypothetical protein DPMN_025651 [Dreissena polymorpha]|uniref:Uncharacterized protein n=1 Tax=Dreissena polymorpha TaxID=45954 RepID=A0A9D4RCR1_DREPO|nr:hypothetical protein DPMN_025651 [Dreissena polymorpha]